MVMTDNNKTDTESPFTQEQSCVQKITITLRSQIDRLIKKHNEKKYSYQNILT
jgi:hypothetical protein